MGYSNAAAGCLEKHHGLSHRDFPAEPGAAATTAETNAATCIAAFKTLWWPCTMQEGKKKGTLIELTKFTGSSGRKFFCFF
jgi:hypothetical protein